MTGPGSVVIEYSKAHLIRFLVFVLLGIVLLRLVVMFVINGDRLPGDKLEGLDIHGRYYPVEKVCRVVDDGDLADGLAGTPLDTGPYSLSAVGNTFEVNKMDSEVVVGCGWQNRSATDNPDVSYRFTALLSTDASKNERTCDGEANGRRFTMEPLGGHSACRIADNSSVLMVVVEDNVAVGCSVHVLDRTLLPALTKSMPAPCRSFVDRLGRARPVKYAGNAFLTVR